MKKLRLFLDTSVLLSAILGRNKKSWALLNSIFPKIELITSDFAIKELNRTLRKEYGESEENINAAVDFIYGKCEVVKKPRREEFVKFNIRDKNDRPIICSAIKEKCNFLVTEDKYLEEDAEKHIPTITPDNFTPRRVK
jgi:putative PIN family toxin of toxin-antitoxin system